MSDTLLLIIIIAGVLVAVLLVILFIYFFVIRKNKIRKEVRAIDKDFQYYHALLIGQDSQYVKRLEIISRTNLLYVEIHTRFLKSFKEIRDKHDANAQSAINHLFDLISDHHYKQAKNYLLEAKQVVEDFSHLVSDLNNQLLEVVKPEEECRQASLALKEQLRRVKQDYFAKQGELVMVAPSFEKVFSGIDSLFEDFEKFVESAAYDEANNILPQIDRALTELANSIIELPNLCVLVSDVLPNKISALENKYNEMSSRGYPLTHLCVTNTISEMRALLEHHRERLLEFNTKGIDNELDAMQNRIEEFYKKFDEEVEAKKSFDEQNEGVYRNVNLIERRFIKLCNVIPTVSRIYVINDAHKNKVNEIQTGINKIGALKRSLDTLIHAGTKQPYSLLVGKMNELKSASDSIILELDSFATYLNSLKTDSEEAYNLLFSFFDKLKRAEKEIRDINISRLEEKYTEEFNRSYELLNSINDLLKQSPINVDEVNKNVAELYEVSNNILDDGSIAQEHNMMTLAENAIMYANKGRAHLSDIDQLVAQAETFFNEGDFEQAYIIAGNALKKIKANNERQ